MSIYLAAPLFSQAERQWNRQLAQRIEEETGCTVVLPQDFLGGKEPTGEDDLATLYRMCIEGVEECDAVVAVLDGPDADSGTAFEMGYARALAKPIVGVRTDFREHQDTGTNLMLARSCHSLVHEPSTAGDVAAVAQRVCKALRDGGVVA